MECTEIVDDKTYSKIWGEGLGTMKIKPVSIPYDKARPIVQERYRPIPLQYHDKLSELIREMEKWGKVEKVNLGDYPNSWLSNPRITEKKSGDIRLNLDARRPNTAIDHNAEPMPTPEQVRHKLNGATRLSEFDLRHGYWQVPIDEESMKLGLFHTHEGIYRFKCLFFGGKQASGQFQTAMNKCFTGIRGVEFIADNVVVIGRDEEDHKKNLRKFLD